MMQVLTEHDLIAVALALLGPGAELSEAERRIGNDIRPWRDKALVADIRAKIEAGDDPLGEMFARIRTPERRRAEGATYTPSVIVSSMVSWAAEQAEPARVVDAGAGSGRFLLAAARKFPQAKLVAVECDPLAALVLRANVAVSGFANRTTIVVNDYRAADLPEIAERTLFIGNPPYVRHHAIGGGWKEWYARAAKGFGLKASKLAGLHIHFFMRTLQLARPGDYGTFITSAEWLDVNYGATLRQLLADGLGGIALHVLDPKAMPFADAATTAAITCFHVGERRETLRVRAVETLDKLNGLSVGTPVPWTDAKRISRWSTIVRPGPSVPPGFVELGEICRVHRGQVTGNNDVWIAGPPAAGLPEKILVPAVTKAKDILSAGDALVDASRLRKIIDLPADLDELEPAAWPAVERFLDWAKRQGADRSYIARHRRAWWSVGLREPAPIVCTYMARRPPAFVRNLCAARHINIAHGLYPRQPLSKSVMDVLATWLRNNVSQESGRTYAGGLTKFEPRELERVHVPRPENLVV